MKKKIVNIYNEVKNNEKLYKAIVLILFSLFAIWGIAVYQDYGISYDEIIERGHSISLWQYLYNKFSDGENVPALISEYTDVRSFSKYYGVAIRIPLMISEYINEFSMTNEQIYYQAHLYTFILFYISSICMYKIGRELLSRKKYSILLWWIYIICPRILADSFYNIKDSVFLSLTVIILYYQVMYLKYGKKNSLIGLCLFTAFGVNTRIIAGIYTIIFCIFYILKDNEYLKSIKKLLVYAIMSVSCYILINPFSWDNPFGYIINVLGTFSDFTLFSANVGLLNNVYQTTNLPWFYTIVCICLTLPTFYIIYSIIGIFYLIREKKNKLSINDYLIKMILIQFIFIIFLDIVMRPTKYNMWRHYYFLFAYIVILCVVGIRYIIDECKKYYLVKGTYVVLLISFVYLIVWIGNNHPYEYLYFNHFYTSTVNDKTDRDYWQTSAQNTLKNIIDYDMVDVNVTNGTASLFFGENGWENYHSNSRSNDAEYKMTWYTSAGQNNNVLYYLYDVLNIDDRDISYVYKRKNYNNLIKSFYVQSQEDRVIGDCDSVNIEYNDENTKCNCLITYDDNINAKEIDILYQNNVDFENVEVIVSNNGIEWDTYYSESNYYIGDNMIGVILDTDYKYVKIAYNKTTQEDFLISIYGNYLNKSNNNDIIFKSSEGSDSLQYINDGDLNTRWTSGISRTEGMWIELDFKEKKNIYGIKLDYGNNMFDMSDDMKIYYVKDGEKKEVLYSGYENELYFNDLIETDNLIIVNNEDSGFFWSINEVNIIDDSYVWNRNETDEIIEKIETSSNSELLEYLTDGKDDTVWESASNNNDDNIITIKTHNEYIKGICLQLDGNILNRAIDLNIEGSMDGENYENIKYHLNATGQYIFDEDENYHYYKLTNTCAINTWKIGEIGIFK